MAPVEQAAVDEPVELLDLEDIELDVLRGGGPDIDGQRVFDGQVAGQAVGQEGLIRPARAAAGR